MAIYIPAKKDNANNVNVGNQNYDVVYYNKQVYWRSVVFVPYQILDYNSEEWFVNKPHELFIQRVYDKTLHGTVELDMIPFDGVIEGGNTIAFDDGSQDKYKFTVTPTSRNITLNLDKRENDKFRPLMDEWAPAVKVLYKIVIKFNWEGVQKFIVNGVTYFPETESIEVTEGSVVSWNAFSLMEYELENSSGLFIATDFENGYTLDTGAVLRKVTLTFDWVGVKSYTINGLGTFDSKTTWVRVDYGTYVSWIATALPEYNITNTGSLVAEDLEKGHIISAEAELKDVEIRLIWDNIEQFKINGDIYINNNPEKLYFKYGTTINWSAVPDYGYKLTYYTGSFTATNFTDGHDIDPLDSPVKVPVNIIINEGIKSLTIAGTTYTYNTVIYCNFAESITWSYALKPGYSSSELNNQTLEITNVSGHNIAPTASLQSVSVKVTFNTGIEEISVNGISYNSDTTVVVDYDSTVIWTCKSSYGYTVDKGGDSFKANDLTPNKYVITPTASPVQVPINIVINKGVEGINIKGNIYNSTTTIYVNYDIGDVIWECIPEPGYTTEYAEPQTLTVSNISGHTIAPTATISTIEITISRNTGVEEIIVNGKSYFNSTTLTVDYNTEIIWSAKPVYGYSLDSSNGGFNATDLNGYEIAPTASSVQVPISIVINEGIESVQIGGVIYSSNTIIYVDYTVGSVNWICVPKAGYTTTFGRTQTLNITDVAGHTIAPTATINKVSIEIVLDDTINKITVNGIEYLVTTTIEVDYNTNIVWSAIPNPGYDILSEGGSFNAINPSYQIKPSTKETLIPINIIVNEGISSITILGIDDITYTVSTTIYKPYLSRNIRWKAEVEKGYQSDELSGTIDVVDNIIGHDIAPTAIIKISTINITKNEGIEEITVNGVSYTSSQYIEVNYNSTVIWSAKASEGYTVDLSNDSFIVNKDSYEISPTATISQVPITITLNNGVERINIGENYYESTSIIYVDYNSSIVWDSEPSFGYKISGDDSGTFVANSMAGHTISPIAVIKTTTINVIKNLGVEEIIVNGVSYNDSTIINANYNTLVTWSAKSSKGYSIDTSNDTFVVAKDSYDISPTASVAQIPISIVINEGIANITIAGKNYESTTIIYVDYNTTVSWTYEVKYGYTIDKIGDQSFKATILSGYTISPTTTVNVSTINIIKNPGVDEIIVNGISYSNSTTITMNYHALVTWAAKASTGYILDSDNDSFVVSEDSYTIAPTATILDISVRLKFHEGLNSLVVNGTSYDHTQVISFVYGTTVNWSATADMGYSLPVSSGSFMANIINGHEIAPLVIKLLVPINIIIGSNVKKISVNGVDYGVTSSITVLYGTNVSWVGELEEGYATTGAISGNFDAVDLNGYTITVDGTIYRKSYTISVVINQGVGSVTVSGSSYPGMGSQTFTSDGTLTAYYGDNLVTSTEPADDYLIEPASFNTNEYITRDITIAPTAVLDKNPYDISVVVNRGVERVTVNGSAVIEFASMTFTETGFLIACNRDTLDIIPESKVGYTLNDDSFDSEMYVDRPLIISPTATPNKYDLGFTKNTGIDSITVSVNGVNVGTFTASSPSILNTDFDDVIEWTTSPTIGYTLIEGDGWTAKKGSETLGLNSVIAPTASQNIYTVSFALPAEGIDSAIVNGGSATNKQLVGNLDVITATYGQTITWSYTPTPGFTADSEPLSPITIVDDTVIVITSTHITYAIGFSKTTGVRSVIVKLNGENKGTFTSSNNDIFGSFVKDTVEWTSQSEEGYTMNYGSSWNSANGAEVITAFDSTRTIAPTAYLNYYNITVIVSSGVYYVAVSGSSYPGNSNQTFYSSGSMTAHHFDTLYWTAYAYDGYHFGSSNYTTTQSGSVYITGPNTISPSAATINIYTVYVSLGTGVASATISGGISGSVSTSSSTSFSAYHGATISYTAYAEGGYTWGGSTSTSGTLTYNLTGDASYVISGGDLSSAGVTVSWGTGVSGVKVNGIARYNGESWDEDYGTVLTWNATVMEGYTASSNCSGTVTVYDSPVSIYCSALTDSYTVSVSFDSGISSVNVNGVNRNNGARWQEDYGTFISWSANLKDGYEAVSGCTGSVTITGDYDIVCSSKESVVTPTKYTVTVNFDSGINSVTVNGTAYSPSGKSFEVNAGTSITWSSNFKEGYEANSGCSGTATVNSNYTINATSREIPVVEPSKHKVTVAFTSLTASCQADGGSRSDGYYWYVNDGDSASATFTCMTGYHYGASNPNSNTTNTITKTNITSDVTLQDGQAGNGASAAITINKYTVTVNFDSGINSVTVNGTAYTPSGKTFTVDHGTSISWSTAFKDGYEEDTGCSGSATITDDYVINAKSKLKPAVQHKVTITYAANTTGCQANGGARANGYSWNVNDGDSATAVFSCKANYHYGNNNTTTTNTVTMSNIKADTELKDENASINQYTVTVNFDSGINSVTANGTKYTTSGSTFKVDHGTRVEWSSDIMSNHEEDSGCSGSVTVTSDFTIDAKTTIKIIPIYKIQIASNDNSLGTASASAGSRTITSTMSGVYLEVPEGGSYSISASANSGSKFVRWDDGNTTASRTLTGTADTLWSAIFEKEGYNVGGTTYTYKWDISLSLSLNAGVFDEMLLSSDCQVTISIVPSVSSASGSCYVTCDKNRLSDSSSGSLYTNDPNPPIAVIIEVSHSGGMAGGIFGTASGCNPGSVSLGWVGNYSYESASATVYPMGTSMSFSFSM